MSSTATIRKVIRMGRSIAIVMTDVIPKDWQYVKVGVVSRSGNKVVVEIEKLV